MKKIHTRIKRWNRLTTSKQHYSHFHPQEVPHRPKTYASEATARAAAEKKGIKKYELIKVKRGKRFQIVEQK